MYKQLLVLFLLISVRGLAQQEIALYTGKIPNSRTTTTQEQQTYYESVDTVVTFVSQPTLSVFLPAPEKANGTAVLVIPGGGYHALLINREGKKVARELNKLGVAAFVLKYRLPSDESMMDKSIGPMQDAQQAIMTIREKATEWKIDPHKIGVLGFSAGGHLAATTGTHYSDPVIENPQNTSLRPDFMILINPVISFTDSIGHIGTRDNLLGKNPAAEQIKYYSNELHINKSTPPTFLVHAGDDTVVPVENSILFYENLRKQDIPAELHIYSKGEHGFLKVPSFEEWFGRCVNWMKETALVH